MPRVLLVCCCSVLLCVRLLCFRRNQVLMVCCADALHGHWANAKKSMFFVCFPFIECGRARGVCGVHHMIFPSFEKLGFLFSCS